MECCRVLAGGEEQRKLPALPIPFDEQRWGEVTDWEAPMPGVYELETVDNTGIYVVDISQGNGLLPKGMFSYGIPYEDGKYVYFDHDYGRYVAEYEVLLHLSRCCPLDKKQELLEKALLTAILGMEEYAGYFGPYTPQHTTPWGRLARHLQVDNGIWFIQAGGVWALDVCCDLSQNLDAGVQALAKYAPGLNTDANGDLYWELEDCAPAVWELLDLRPALETFITSVDDLQCCLCELFPQYVSYYNKGVEDFDMVTKKSGASIRFLKLPI